MPSPLRAGMVPRRSDLKGLLFVQFWLIRVNGTLRSGFEILVVPFPQSLNAKGVALKESVRHRDDCNSVLLGERVMPPTPCPA